MKDGRRTQENMRRRRTPAEHRKRKIMRRLVLGVLYLFTGMILVGLVLVGKMFFVKEKKADINVVYGLEGKENEAGVVVGREIVSSASALIIDNTAYLDMESIKKYCNSRFYLDYEENLVIFTTPTEVIKAYVGQQEYLSNNETTSVDYDIVKSENGQTLVALEFVKKFSNIDYNIGIVKKHNLKIILIDNQWGEITVGKSKRTKIYMEGSKKSEVLATTPKNKNVIVYDKGKKWSLIRTEDGLIGYVKASKVKKSKKENRTSTFVQPEYTSIEKNYKINMVWDMVTNMQANDGVIQRLDKTKDINTISPTWFALENETGEISSLASDDYVDTCRNKNIEVWGLVSNDFDKELSYKVLSSTPKREKLVNNIISKALEFKLAGVNIDFEALSKETGEHYIQFLRELSILCRKNQIVLSVDNYVPASYNLFYNRKEQGVIADYIVIMGYDEHFEGSETAGSVASIDFVRNGIKETIQEVPGKKVINALPFYTRLWKTKDGKVTSEAYTMNNTQTALSRHGINTKWDDKTKQYYGEVSSGAIKYQVWVEDVRSLEEKLKVMSEFEMAGVAAWRLGQESDDVWNAITRYLN